MNNQAVGLIGGTGSEGRGIALRLAAAGHEVVIGSRSAERAAGTAAEINRRLASRNASGCVNADLFERSRLLFLTVPFEHAADLLQQHRAEFREGHVLVDVTVPLVFRKGPRLTDLAEGSAAEHLRARLPAHVPLVATFKTFPAALLERIEAPLEGDEFVCHDSGEARDLVLSVLEGIEGVRWLDAGPLRYCRALEAMTMLVIGLNRRYGSHEGRFAVHGL